MTHLSIRRKLANLFSRTCFTAAASASHCRYRSACRYPGHHPAESGHWLLKALVRCGVCSGRTPGGSRPLSSCCNHDPIRAGGADRRCPERGIRAEALDTYVFDRIRIALLQTDTLLAGERGRRLHPDTHDELLAAELTRLDRKIAAADDERLFLADLYQAWLLALGDAAHASGPENPAPQRW